MFWSVQREVVVKENLVTHVQWKMAAKTALCSRLDEMPDQFVSSVCTRNSTC